MTEAEKTKIQEQKKKKAQEDREAAEQAVKDA